MAYSLMKAVVSTVVRDAHARLGSCLMEDQVAISLEQADREKARDHQLDALLQADAEVTVIVVSSGYDLREDSTQMVAVLALFRGAQRIECVSGLDVRARQVAFRAASVDQTNVEQRKQIEQRLQQSLASRHRVAEPPRQRQRAAKQVRTSSWEIECR